MATNSRRTSASEGRRGVLRRSCALLCAGGLAPWLAACGGSRAPRGRVVVYASADDVLARAVLSDCERATGVVIDAVFDTEATKTVGLENRLRAEASRPRADLFWSSEGFAAVRLANAGLLRALPEPVWSAWPEAHRDPARRWLAFAARARVVVQRKGAAEPIARWSDLARPGLARGSAASIAIADPRFGTTNGHIAALDVAWDAARARGIDAPTLDAWLDGMRANGVRVLTGGNSATVEAVATGECAYGLTDTDDALAAIARGRPLEMSLPRTLPEGVAGGGTMIVPNTVSLVEGGPGARDAAEAVAAYLVSPACEALIAASESRNMPLGRQASASVAAAFREDDPLAFDLAQAAGRAAARAVDARRRLVGESA